MSGSNMAGQTGVYGTLDQVAAANVPGARYLATGWTDLKGNFWLFGGDNAPSVQGDLNDLWMYAPSTGEWTWMSGSDTANQPGVYGTLGVPTPGNTPGARDLPVSWTDPSGNLWLFGGEANAGADNFNDLWEYTPQTGEWTWISGSNTYGQDAVYGMLGVPAPGNVPSARFATVGWTDLNGNLWLFGGLHHNGNCIGLNDLWMYTPSTAEWTWMGGTQANNQVGVYGTEGVPDPANIPSARIDASSWTDPNGNLWLFGGSAIITNIDGTASAGPFNDLWKYTPSTGLWTWMGGSNPTGFSWDNGKNTWVQPGVYGTIGVSAASNLPGGREDPATWTDSKGNLWLFGGLGYDVNGEYGDLNDLWVYIPSTGEWTWMGGSDTLQSGKLGQPGIYGVLGVPAAANVPGGRYPAAAWTSPSGTLWLFGGSGYDATDSGGFLNDLWEYTPPSPVLAPDFALANGGSITATAGNSGTSTLTVAPSGGFTGTVNFTCSVSSSPAGLNCSAPSANVTGTSAVTSTLTVDTTPSTPAGSYTATVIAADAATEKISQTTSVSITVSPAPSFVAGAGGSTSITVTAGATTGNIGTISVTGTNGFSGTVSLTCNVTTSMTGVNDMPTCSLNPTSVTISGSTAQTSTLSVNTTAPSSAENNLPWLFGSASGGTALALFAFLPVLRRRRNWIVTLGLIVLFVSLGMAGCGGGSSAGGSGGSGGGGGNSTPGTTPGAYTVTVTGTSGSLSVTVGTVTLTVQ
jgi:N-acetylneuraminic acid mutarotase